MRTIHCTARNELADALLEAKKIKKNISFYINSLNIITAIPNMVKLQVSFDLH